jgi:hypothetical protein
VRFSVFLFFFAPFENQLAVRRPQPGPGGAADFAPFWFVGWDEDELGSGKIFIARFWLLEG